MEEKVNKEIKTKLDSMPTKFCIGDPSYINDEASAELVYKRSFKNKTKWVGSATLREINVKAEPETSASIYLTVIYAPTQKYLDLYENKQIYKHQELINFEIRTKTSKYILDVGHEHNEIEINYNGLCVDIVELYGHENRLEGIIMNFNLGSGAKIEQRAIDINKVFGTSL